MTSVITLLTELEEKLHGRVDSRQVLRLLQKLSSNPNPPESSSSVLTDVLSALWNHDLLLDDCILVSGILYVRSKLAASASIEEILKKESYDAYKHSDWVRLGIVRGLLVVGSGTVPSAPTLSSSSSSATVTTTASSSSSLRSFLPQLLTITESGMLEAIQTNRLILVARHLENLIQCLELEYTINESLPQTFNSSISGILSKALLVKYDLVEYKCRDLIKLQYRSLALSVGSEAAEEFLLGVLALLPEVGKVALQCFDAALDDQETGISDSLARVIFEQSLPMIKVKGLGQTAAKCVAKTLNRLQLAEALIGQLFGELNELPGSKEKLSFIKILFAELDGEARSALKARLEVLSPPGQGLVALLRMLIDSASQDAVLLEQMLHDADEYYSFEAFSILVREAQSSRRKPVETIAAQDLMLFKGFLQAISFSASVELRQKVLATSKAFYEQIFGRLYHLIREGHKNRLADRDLLQQETDSLLVYLRDLFLTVFIEPFDFVRSNCGSLEFVLKQILLVLASFEGNPTLAGANAQFMQQARGLFRTQVLNPTVLQYSCKFLQCVGHSTYDNLRLLSGEILFKCQLPASELDVEPYYALLVHPRAINNEGAARMIQLYAKLQSPGNPNTVCASIAEQVDEMFAQLKQSFPASLMENNVNGRLLALRFLLSDAHSTAAMDKEMLDRLIERTIEIATFVAGVASHPSPEGLDLEDQVDAIEVVGEPSEDEHVDNNNNNTLPSSQYVLSFAWRAIKESSLLLETIVTGGHLRLVDAGLIDKIAKHFIQLLLSLRHRGAFSSVEGPLTSVLKHGFTFPEIKKTLAELLQVALRTEEISSTRRSAGLPHLILAIVHSCAKSCEIDELLSILIPELTQLATDATGGNGNGNLQDPSPSLIHSFNITRSLVRDSRIAGQLSRHMGQVALMCLNTFNSPSWSVRNASSMLLSSLIARVFGSAHLNQHSAAADDQIDLRELEVKFHGLLEVLESFMRDSMARGAIEARLAYPLLAVLERIKIPSNERFDSLRATIRDYLLQLLRDLSGKCENGRKLIHVLSRVLCSLVANASLRSVEAGLLVGNIDWTLANSVFNHLVLLETLASRGLVDAALLNQQIIPQVANITSCHPEWNPIIQQYLTRLQSLSQRQQQQSSVVDNAVDPEKVTPVVKR